MAGLRAALTSADSQLIADRTLDGAAGSANQVRDSASAYSSSGDSSHLATLQDHLDVVLASVGIGAFFDPKVVDAMRDSLTRYRRAGREFVSNLDASATSLRGLANKVAASLANLDEQIAAEVAKVAAEVATKVTPLDTRVSELSDRIAAETTRVTTLIENQAKASEDARKECPPEWWDFERGS